MNNPEESGGKKFQAMAILMVSDLPFFPPVLTRFRLPGCGGICCCWNCCCCAARMRFSFREWEEEGEEEEEEEEKEEKEKEEDDDAKMKAMMIMK